MLMVLHAGRGTDIAMGGNPKGLVQRLVQHYLMPALAPGTFPCFSTLGCHSAHDCWCSFARLLHLDQICMPDLSLDEATSQHMLFACDVAWIHSVIEAGQHVLKNVSALWRLSTLNDRV